MDTYCLGCKKGVERHILSPPQVMRKHLDKVCEDAGTPHGLSSVSSVSGRMVSKVERGSEQAVRAPDQTALLRVSV